MNPLELRAPSGPQGPPPDALGGRDPVGAFEEVRRAVLSAYGKDGQDKVVAYMGRQL